MSEPAFIHLRVHSVYSLLEGAIGIKDLTKWCAKYDMPAVAVADHGNLFGSLEFAQAAAEAGVQPLMATILNFAPYLEGNNRPGTEVKPDQLLLIAQNEQGWSNLMKLSSRAFLEGTLTYADLEGLSEGLLCLTGGIYGGIGKCLLAGQQAKAEALLQQLGTLFPGRLYIEIMRHNMPEEKSTEAGFVELALKANIPLVATNDAYFIEKDMYEAHDAFLCISEGTYVGEENRRRLTPNHRLKKPEEMTRLFEDMPEALASSVNIARRCAFMAPARKPILPSYVDEDGNTDADAMLRNFAREGLQMRMGKDIPQAYRDRLEFEIDTIISMKFPGYFLIVSDFIRWSKAQGIPVGPGRGSGAGSLVAWALSITDLDPIRYGLLFERFLNPQRVSMPDFDVDFCQDRRDEVIAYVQKRYGHDRVAQIITFGKLQARAVLRDAGRVLQMPYGQVDKICKLVPANPAAPVTLAEALEIEPMLKAARREDETVDRLVEISLKLEGLNRHASTHAAGVVIADRPLQELVPLYRDPKSDMPVVQYSMKYAESAGLVKFDFLGLKTLTVLVKAVEMIRTRGIELDLLKLPEGDQKTYEMLGRGETVGVFQLEGQGMRDTIKKLKPTTLEEIIALVSLYRPGPMDNIPTYINRKHGNEKPEYLHPKIEKILRETYGVIVYQEQVMQIAQELAGYSLGEADLLRRAMGKKIKSEMEAQRDIFVEKAVDKGVDKQQAAGIFDLIAKFAEYGFNKSHAAAYALIAYQTAYCKANFTVEFFAASMTYDMHNTDKLGVFREDASRFGVQLLPPDINTSGVYFTVDHSSFTSPLRGEVGAQAPGGGDLSSAMTVGIRGGITSTPEQLKNDIRMSFFNCSASPHQGGGNIRYALAAVRNVGAQAMQAVMEEREKSGPYKDIFDFIGRMPAHVINKRAIEFLVKAGAFDALHKNRAQLFAALDIIVSYGEGIHRDREAAQENLFGGPAGGGDRPPLPQAQDWPGLERLSHEFEAIGFYLSAHPLDNYKRQLAAAGVTPSARLAERLDSKYSPVKVAGIVTGRKYKVSEKGRFAFVQLSDATGVFECSVFNEELLNRHRDRLEVGKVLLIQADGKQDESGVRLIIQNISDLDEEMARRPVASSNALLRIVVDNDKALPPLRELLGTGGNAGHAVMLTAPLPGGKNAEMRLPGRYSVTPAQVDRIRVIQGVLSAEEV